MEQMRKLEFRFSKNALSLVTGYIIYVKYNLTLVYLMQSVHWSYALTLLNLLTISIAYDFRHSIHFDHRGRTDKSYYSVVRIGLFCVG